MDKQLVFVNEARFYKYNNIYYADFAFGDELWESYLEKFSKVIVLARVMTISNKLELDNKIEIKNPNVNFIELPYYVGVIGLLKKYLKLKKVIKSNVQNNLANFFIIRLPGLIGPLVINSLIKHNKNYALEIVGDPDMVFSKDANKSIFRTIFKSITVSGLKKGIKNAKAVLYVTNKILQQKYPVQNNIFSIGVSDVIIPDSITVQSRTKIKNEIPKIISVGSLEQMYKSPEIVLESLAILKSENANFEFTWIGSGFYLESMIQKVQDYNMTDCVNFVGAKSKSEVFHLLENSDIFVLASKTEGMPRALIEAMSFGLPCVATNVGGIPEILEADKLVKVNDAKDLASKLTWLLNDEFEYSKTSQYNLEIASCYSFSKLKEKRHQYFDYIINNL